jgi:hypothetical protein
MFTTSHTFTRLTDCLIPGQTYQFATIETDQTRIKPNYPVPTTIRRVVGRGLADGLFDIHVKGWVKWGVYDNPLPDGSFVVP